MVKVLVNDKPFYKVRIIESYFSSKSQKATPGGWLNSKNGFYEVYVFPFLLTIPMHFHCWGKVLLKPGSIIFSKTSFIGKQEKSF